LNTISGSLTSHIFPYLIDLFIFYITLLYMCIYNPPSKIQSVFNPSNYGSLGAGGQITTDYLDANYLSFSVAQGNTTLVGTSVLGTISQQGNFTTTGNITGKTIEGTSFLVGTTNLLTEINGKLDTLYGGTNITIVDNQVSRDLVGSTNIDITDGVISATELATTTQLGTKQDEIDENTSLNLTSITSNDLIINESLNIGSLITYEKYKQFDTIVIRRLDETYFETIIISEIQC